MSPRRNWDPPEQKGGGNTRLRVRGGVVPISTNVEKA